MLDRFLVEGSGLLGESAGLGLGPRLQLLGDRLSMPEQGRGAFAACGLGGRADRTVLHGGHAPILAEDRQEREGHPVQ